MKNERVASRFLFGNLCNFSIIFRLDCGSRNYTFYAVELLGLER